jgi:hypothetical protein
MSKVREFDNILNECLGRLIEGESIEACLSRYPQYAAELEPLLRTAQDTLKATDIKPRPEFRQRAGYQFQAAIRDMPAKGRRDFFIILKPSLATIITVVIVLLAGSGTVAASSNSLPDSPLYQVKLATEAVRLALEQSPLGKAELNAQFADERVDEIVRMVGKGDAELIEKATDRMNKHLVAVANLTATGEATAESAQFSALQAPAPVTDGGSQTMVPAPMPTPTPTTAPVPEGTPPPAITVTTPQEEAPMVVAKQAPAPNEDGGNNRQGGTKDDGGKPDKQEQLKNTLSQQSLENLQALQNELEKAPESLKPALRRAIEVAGKAYAEALENLDN